MALAGYIIKTEKKNLSFNSNELLSLLSQDIVEATDWKRN